MQDDVFIGVGAIILDRASISKGAMVGVGSVVVKDVPPNTIIAGGTAKIAI